MLGRADAEGDAGAGAGADAGTGVDGAAMAAAHGVVASAATSASSAARAARAVREVDMFVIGRLRIGERLVERDVAGAERLPQRPALLAVDGGERRLHRGEPCRFARGQVAAFAGVRRQVVEPIFARHLRDLQLPVALTEREVIAGAPEQPLVRPSVLLAARERQQVDAVDDAVGGHRDARRRGGGGEDVDMADRCAEGRARGQSGGPAHQQRHADAALEVAGLPSSQRGVAARQVDVVRRAVVVGEDHQRVAVEPGGAQRCQHAADIAVERADHGGVHAQAVVGDGRERVVVLARRLQRGVRCVVGEIEEERTVAVRFDDAHGMVREVVGEVAVGLEQRPVVEAHAPRRRRVEELVDGVVRGARVDDARVVLGQEHRGRVLQRQRFVEAVRVRPEPRAVAEVPFADLHGVVAAVAQQARERDLGGRQAHVLVGRLVRAAVAEIDRAVQGRALALGLRHDPHELLGGRRELEAEARGVAPGHDRGARRGAGGVAGVGHREVDALARDGVDVGRRHEAVGDAAAAQREVGVAEVVDHDQHDVGRAARALDGDDGRGGALLPLDLAERRVVLAHEVLHIEEEQPGAAAGRLHGRVAGGECADEGDGGEGEDACRSGHFVAPGEALPSAVRRSCSSMKRRS